MRIESVSVDVLGQCDVVVRVEGGEQIKPLKDKADFVTAQQGARGIAHGREVVAIEEYAPGGGLGEATDHVQHGGFAAPGRAHDGDEFAGKNVNADAAQGGYLYFALT